MRGAGLDVRRSQRFAGADSSRSSSAPSTQHHVLDDVGHIVVSLDCQTLCSRLQNSASIEIPPGASVATLQLRPSGIGRLELTASSGGHRSEPVALALEWPLLPIGALLLGGALGGLVSAFRPRHHRQISRRVVEGAVMGLLVTLVVLVVPGVASVAAGALATELGLFVVSAVAGFAGVPLVDRIARLVFPTLNAKPPGEQRDDARGV